MAAALGKGLVLQHDGVGPGTLQHPHRVHHIDGVAKASVPIHQQRDVDRIANGAHMGRQLGQRHQANVGRTQIGVGHGSPTDHQHLMPGGLDHPGGQRIGCTRHQMPGTGREGLAKLLVQQGVGDAAGHGGFLKTKGCVGCGALLDPRFGFVNVAGDCTAPRGTHGRP